MTSVRSPARHAAVFARGLADFAGEDVVKRHGIAKAELERDLADGQGCAGET